MRRASMRARVVGLVLLGATAWPCAVSAQTVTDEGAQALEKSFSDTIARWTSAVKDGATVTWKGAVKVAPSGDHYMVTVPALSAKADDKSGLEGGESFFKLRPLAGGTYEVLEGMLPATWNIQDTNGKAGGRISLGGQHLTGIWSPEFETFLRLDFSIKDIKGAPADADNGAFSIGAVNIRGELTDNGQGRWSGPYTLALSDVRVLEDRETEILRLGGLALDTRFQNIDLARAAAISKKVDALDALGKVPAKDDAAKAARDKEVSKALLDLLGDMQGLVGGFESKFTVTDLTGHDFGEDEDDTTKINLKSMSFQWGVEGLDTDAGTVRFAYGHDGFSLKPSPFPKEFTPATAAMAISVANLPSSQLWQTFRGFLGTVVNDGKQADEVAMLLGPQLLDMLSKAGAEIRVEAVKVGMPSTSGFLSGSARFNSQAAFGLAGSFDTVLTGIDSAIKALKPGKGQKVSKDTQETLQALTLIQTMGQAGKDSQGRDTRTYKVEMRPDGKFTLNGVDISTLMEGR